MSHAMAHGHGEHGSAGAFLVMWAAMMAAMMLPSLIPMLRRYRHAVGPIGETRLAPLTALVGIGYFSVWTLLGLAALPLSVALAHAVPITVAAIVLTAGAFQFSRWKSRSLACCRQTPARPLPAGVGAAWRHGVRLGLECAACCGNLMVIALAIGAMNPGAMALVTTAITAERLMPKGDRIARVTGSVIVVAGMVLIAQATL
jgi:predicted metal-binding membrane protein